MQKQQLVLLSLLLPAALLGRLVPTTSSSPAQDLADKVSDAGSDLARMSKSEGALMQRESHKLPKVNTSYGEDIECRVLILKNLIGGGVSSSTKPVGGLVFSVKEKYSSKSLYVDKDEIEAILAAMNFLDGEGLGVVQSSLLELGSAAAKSTEIHYTTRDGLVLGVFESKGALTYALKIGRTADWALLSEPGTKTLKSNLEKVSQALKTL